MESICRNAKSKRRSSYGTILNVVNYLTNVDNGKQQQRPGGGESSTSTTKKKRRREIEKEEREDREVNILREAKGDV